MKPLLTAVALTALLALSAHATSPFDSVVAHVQSALAARPEHPRLLGTAVFFARLAHPHEASGLHLALFQVPAVTDATSLAARTVDSSWSCMVRNSNRASGDTTFVYVRPQNHSFQMLVFSLDARSHELTLVTVHLHDDQLLDAADHHRPNH